MSSLACTRCGAEIIPGTRFCRQCGQPAPDTAGVSEAATRILGAPERTAAPTDRFTPLPTGPAYISPTDAGAPQPQSSQALQMTPKKKRGKVWLFILLAIVLFGAIASVAIVTAIKTSHSLARKVIIKPTTEVPQPQQPPAVPGLPSPPASGATTIDNSLLYPGAQTQLDIGGEEGRVLQLHTNDSLDKVTDWYIAKLKPAQIVRKPSGGSTVLHSDRANVVISASDGGGTSILIEQGSDQ